MTMIPCRTLWGELREVSQDRIIFRPAVYALIVDAERVLLLRNRLTGYAIFPGGGLHLGERIDVALHREVQEETGFSVTIGPLVHVADYNLYYDPTGDAYHCLALLYHCTVTSGQLQADAGTDTGEAEPPRWVPLAAVTAAMFQHHFQPVAALLPRLSAGVFFPAS